MTIDVWADVICPWCYIGEHRLEEALRRFPHVAEIEFKIQTFLLDPTLTTEVKPTADTWPLNTVYL